MNVFQKMFGTHSEREVKRIMPLVEKIEKLRPTMIELSDEELRGKTAEYKKRLAEGETLDDLLPEAYATVRESARRVLNMEHYRVQLIGGIILTTADHRQKHTHAQYSGEKFLVNLFHVILVLSGLIIDLLDSLARRSVPPA